MDRTTTSTGRAWLPGLTVGLTTGFASLQVGLLGWLLAAAFAAAALVVGPRLASIGGLLCGSGGVWVVLLSRVALTCTAGDGEIGCQAPGIEFWLAAGGVQLGLGVALTALAVARDRASQEPPRS